ncbi:MAG: hypothetical protein JNL98_14670 [Bryobacterales bacterium]|nr:hypothetical protein [Bryobacterales bacterium]
MAASRFLSIRTGWGAWKRQPENTYWERTGSIQKKLQLLGAVHRRKDYRLVRVLAHSIRNTAIQAQSEEPAGTPGAVPVEEVQSLPAPWREWARGWRHYQVIALNVTVGQNRPPELVELTIAAPATRCESLDREAEIFLMADSAACT